MLKLKLKTKPGIIIRAVAAAAAFAVSAAAAAPVTALAGSESSETKTLALRDRSSFYDLYYTTDGKEVKITSAETFGEGSIDIPAYIDGLPVTEIGYGAFYSKELYYVYIPETVREIGESAFEDCPLKYAFLSEGLERIGKNAFYGTSLMKSLYIPDSVKEIEENAVGRSYRFVEDSRSWKINNIDGFYLVYDKSAAAGEYAETYSMPVLPPDTREVSITGKCGEDVTYNVYPDHTLVLSGTGSTYDYWDDRCVPYLLSPLTVTFDKAEIGSGITRLGDGFFYNSKLTSLDIPDNVTQLGRRVLYDSGKLKELHIGKGIADLKTEQYTLSYTVSLEKMTVSPDNPSYMSYNNCIYSKDGKTLVKYNTASAAPFSVRKGTEIIGHDSCSSLALTKVVVPEGIKEIGQYAFDDCQKLTDIYIPKSAAEFGGNFVGKYRTMPENESHVKEDITVHCYFGSEAADYADNKGLRKQVTYFSSLLGDTDDNGTVNMKDYVLLQKALNSFSVQLNEGNSDLNGDGTLNMRDYSLLQKLLNGYKVTDPRL